MDAEPPVRLTLDVVRGSDPIRGVIRGHGRECAFQGWLELAAALDAALGDVGRPPETEDLGAQPP